MASRDELKADVERLARDAGHTLGVWLDLGHASQLGCLACDRYAFVQLAPPPPRIHADALSAPCPSRGDRLIRSPE
jgi:hypothetical protein